LDLKTLTEVPAFERSINTTGCCPKFNSDGWHGRDLHFRDKRMVRAVTMSAFHLPLNMGRVFARVPRHIERSDAFDPDDHVVLSRDISPWTGETLLSVRTPVEKKKMTTLSGDFFTKVFEGRYREAPLGATRRSD
jgi:hypothetical protein